MSSSSVTLFYGLWVKTWSLAFAADAYDKVHPTLLAIDLICARRRRGELSCAEREGKTTAVDLPVEVWELVKQEVIDQAVDDAEQEAIKRTRCHGCRRHLGEQLSEAEAQTWSYVSAHYLPPLSAWLRWTKVPCQYCLRGVYSYGGRGRGAQLSQARQLLRVFGLSLATNEVHFDTESELPGIHDRSAIALPSDASFRTRGFPAVKTDTHLIPLAEYIDSKACDLSPDGFLIPSNPQSRFRRLVHVWRLQLDDPTGGIVITSGELDPDLRNDGLHDIALGEKNEELNFSVNKPRWMLWTHAQRSW